MTIRLIWPASQPNVFLTDADTFAHVQLLVTEYYRLDVLSNFWDVYNVEAEALGQKVVCPPGALPDIDRTRPLIHTPSDLDRLSPPDPYQSGRLPWIRQFSKIFLESTGKLERVYFTAPFSIAANIRGYENKHDVSVTAGVDAALLQNGPLEAIVERIKLYIDKMARNGRCMIHLNQIAAETPPEHIHAAVAACHAYGKHPIPNNLDDVYFEIPKRESFSQFLREKGASID